MTKCCLNPDQNRLVEMIQGLGFGVIKRLMIRGGLPCYDSQPCIIQEIKLDSECEPQPDRRCAELTLKAEFERLLDQLTRLDEGVVDIEVRHGAPFRLIVRRPYEELL
jgi:hypothetical protein